MSIATRLRKDVTPMHAITYGQNSHCPRDRHDLVLMLGSPTPTTILLFRQAAEQ